jgi:hypothetical protein
MKIRRPDRGYSLAATVDDAQSSDPTRYRGNHFCKEDLVRPMKLAYTEKPVHSTTTIRVLPSPHPDPEIRWEPWRYTGQSVYDDSLSDWIRQYRAVRGVGDPQITYLMFDPAHRSAEENKNQFFTNPYWVLFKRCKDARETTPRGAPLDLINPLTSGNPKKIPNPAEMYIAQAIVYERGAADEDGKTPLVFDPPLGLDPDDPRVILMDLGPQLGRAILSACDVLRDGVDPEDVEGLVADGVVDWSEYFEIGDPVGLAGGVFWRTFPTKARDPRPDKSRVRRVGGHQDRGELAEKIGYEVFQTPRFYDHSPDLSAYEELLRARVHPLDEVLQFFSIEDQIAKLCAAIRMRDPANPKARGALVLNLFEWAWGSEYPEYVQMIPDQLWAEFRARAQVTKSGLEAEVLGSPDAEDDAGDANASPAAPRKPRGPDPTSVPDPIAANARKLAERRRAATVAPPAPVEDEDEDEGDAEDLGAVEVLATGEPRPVAAPAPTTPATTPARPRRADAYRERLNRARSADQ